jgi:hypothetical protein
MIRYTLRCDREHEFEAWFRSSADYDRTAAAGATSCPHCGSSKIEKSIMAPAIAGAARGDKVPVAAAPDPRQLVLQNALRELRQKVVENADYVGDRFAEEARKMHYNEIEPRGIYGEATRDEAQSLAEEGIEFQPLPTLPEEQN